MNDKIAAAKARVEYCIGYAKFLSDEKDLEDDVQEYWNDLGNKVKLFDSIPSQADVERLQKEVIDAKDAAKKYNADLLAFQGRRRRLAVRKNEIDALEKQTRTVLFLDDDCNVLEALKTEIVQLAHDLDGLLCVPTKCPFCNSKVSVDKNGNVIKPRPKKRAPYALNRRYFQNKRPSIFLKSTLHTLQMWHKEVDDLESNTQEPTEPPDVVYLETNLAEMKMRLSVHFKSH